MKYVHGNLDSQSVYIQQDLQRVETDFVDVSIPEPLGLQVKIDTSQAHSMTSLFRVTSIADTHEEVT